MIKILLTGGTIDKHYNESNGELDFVNSHIPEILNKGRNRYEVNLQQLMLKDSLEMDDNDRQVILKACEDAEEERVLITHGTDTMVKTATLLGEQGIEKTIVLVGAMVPYVFKESDAVFNMGFALASVQTLPRGVYIVMNGTVFNWNEVKKNRELGVFERI